MSLFLFDWIFLVGNMQFELLLACPFSLDIFPCSILTFPDWLSKSVQEYSFDCHYVY